MQTAVDVLSLIGAAAFTLLAMVTFRTWRRRGGEPAAWAAATFGVLAAVAIIGQFFSEEAEGPGWTLAVKALLAVLVVFPYLLYRFAAAFAPSTRMFEQFARWLTVLVVVWGFALPSLPGPGDPRPLVFNLYIAALVVQWTVLFVAVAGRLWRAGSGQPTLARRRMRMLALGAGGMALLIIIAGATPSDGNVGPLDVGRQAASLGTAILFFIGFAPPRSLRIAWRQPEALAMQEAVADLMTATEADEVARIVLPHSGRLLGARAAVLLDRSGRVVESWGIDPRVAADTVEQGDQHVRVALRTGALVVWASPYSPFFGQEEIELLRSLGVLADLALERTVLFEREHAFIANAAHELRTPIAALTGLSATLTARWDGMTSNQIRQALEAMERQGSRAATLVDRMLDLAFLEHDGVEPQDVALAASVRHAIEVSPPPAGTTIRLEVDEMVRVRSESERLEQVLVNLLTNAYRYGGPDVSVSARCTDDMVEIAVADDGPGIPRELAADIFEPFTRGRSAGHQGTGLGLAITRRLVEVFGGTIRYEPLAPHGARFLVRLKESA